VIRHVVFFKFRADVPEADRHGALSQLSALAAVIDAISTYEVGRDILRRDRSWDAVLVATYADLDAYEAYQRHEAHVRAARRLQSICDQIGSVDYELPTTGLQGVAPNPR
jgi:hypothetical protein